VIKSDRHQKIMSILEDCDQLSIHELARRLGRISAVTVRRDVSDLAAKGLLQRTHGGVARTQRVEQARREEPDTTIQDQIGDVDAIVLPPIEGRGADTLRSMARRCDIPFLAESSQQEGGVYLGPDNFAVSRELGHRAGRMLSGTIERAHVLLVSLELLPNTRSRCDGFFKGFEETFKGLVQCWRVDGRGSFRIALAACRDAFAVHPTINVVFGVNDHSVLAALEASDRSGIGSVAGFAVGGEGGALFEVLRGGRKLRACAALFPEIVGMLAIDVLAARLSGGGMPREVRTPHAILTPDNLGDYYRREPTGWALTPKAQERLLPVRPISPAAQAPKVIGFVPHYPAHDWYRNMITAMRMRADLLGYELRVAAPQAGIAREIRALRQLIARTAASRVRPGDTIVVNGGETSLMLADELAGARELTVVTHSLDVMERLHGRPGLKVILTSGEYQSKQRCLVGPSVGALFETLRVDKAFLSVDGISARFGPSAADERLALAARRFIDASREVIVLADHSVVGIDANHRIAPARSVAEVITDAGSLPADRLALTATGARVTIAEDRDLQRNPSSRLAVANLEAATGR
jgi:DeoR/GlpR family transcriptional regulator of sugar metabolism/ABC-type sugar transport system substrate-binding protein